MQIDRLFQIVYILMDKKKTTAKELAATFDVSRRTIYRDIDTLSLAGIPLYTTKGKGGGIYIMDQFVIDKSILTKEEQNHLLFGLETLQHTGYEVVEDALGKLRHLFYKHDQSWIDVDFSNWRQDEEELTKFNLLKTALLSSKVLTFSYIDANGKKSTRKVYPLKLAFKTRFWYLNGFDPSKEDNRLFKVSRIHHLQVLEETFQRDAYQVKNFIPYDRENIHLKLLIESDMHHRVYDEIPYHAIESTEQGLLVSLEIPEDEWLYNYLFSYGSHIKIIEPPYLKDILLEKALQLADHYKKKL